MTAVWKRPRALAPAVRYESRNPSAWVHDTTSMICFVMRPIISSIVGAATGTGGLWAIVLASAESSHGGASVAVALCWPEGIGSVVSSQGAASLSREPRERGSSCSELIGPRGRCSFGSFGNDDG